MDFFSFIKEYIPSLASLIAAFAAIMCAVITNKNQKRIAYSKMVLEQVKPVMAAYYRCVSIACVMDRRLSNGYQITTYYKKGNEDIDFIKNEKDSLRYIIGDGTEGLKSITLVKFFIIHKKDDQESRKKIIKLATYLRKSLDDAFIYAINNGKNPPQYMIRKIIFIKKQLYIVFGTTDDNEENNEINDFLSPSTPGVRPSPRCSVSGARRPLRR